MILEQQRLNQCTVNLNMRMIKNYLIVKSGARIKHVQRLSSRFEKCLRDHFRIKENSGISKKTAQELQRNLPRFYSEEIMSRALTRRIIIEKWYDEMVVVVVDAAVALKLDRKEKVAVVQAEATSAGANTVGIVEIRS